MSEVLLLGRSIPAIVAALELAKVGVSVRIAELITHDPHDAHDSPTTGAQQDPRLPQRPVRDPGGEVAALFDELASPIGVGAHPEPSVRPVHQPPVQTWLQSRDAEFKPQPFPSYFGIPTTVPITAECVDMLGTGGAFRAYLDRVKPLLTIGKQENFAQLVESRIGKSARELLVELPIFERFGVGAADVEVSIIAPGLNEALTRTGSLTGSALQQLERYVARETTVAPEDGWSNIAARLLSRLEMFGATRFETTHLSLVRIARSAGDGEVTVESDPRGAKAQAADDTGWHGGWVVTDGGGTPHNFDAIIVDDRLPAATAIASGADEPADANFGEELEALSAGRFRIHAEIGIESSEAALLGDGEHEALRTLDDEAGTPWALRVRKADSLSDSPWMLKCSGPVVTPAELQSSRERLTELLGALKLQNFATNARIWVEAAPCATHAERTQQEAKLEAWHGEWDDVLACSEAFSGGELGGALASARVHATHLRRRLTGISD